MGGLFGLLFFGCAVAVCFATAKRYALAWVHEFVFLMNLGDDAFPGRFDKLIWGLALILLGPLGLWAFRRYHAEQWPETVAERYPGKPVMPRDWA